MDNAKLLIEEIISSKPFKKITFSSPIVKSTKDFKIVVNQKQDNNNELFFQFTIYYETKVRHENIFSKKETIEKIFAIIDYGYKQCDIILYGDNIKILTNKHQVCKIIRSKNSSDVVNIVIPSHNETKNYILNEGTNISWLVSLGIMDNNLRIVPKYYKKFRQLNKFLEMIEDIESQIPNNAQIIDFGCGKSYLTFALYHYLNIIKNKNVSIVGLDLKEDVVAECQRLSNMFGFDKLNFLAEDIQHYHHSKGHIDMVISLHACDTATDYAIYNAVKWNSSIIMSVPCCQHELFAQIKNDDFNPLLKHGILKERFAALLTDTLRSSLLECVGYKCSVIEFIDSQHTPKNIMIRAIKKQNSVFDKSEYRAYKNLAENFNVNIKLHELFLAGKYIQ